MTIVGIVSDTHGSLPNAAYAALAECDRLIHAGDIGDPGILLDLEMIAPTTAVLGNNDYDEYGAHVGRFANVSIDGVRFLVAHYPQDVRIGFSGSRALAPGDPLPDICIHGHTHLPELATGPDVRPARIRLCPGSISRPRGGNPRTIAKVFVNAGRVEGARIETLAGEAVLELAR